MDFLSNENKFLLWSVLQESNVFQNIPNEKFEDIRKIFDSSLTAFSQSNQGSDEIVSMNKEIIPILLSKVHTIANSSRNKLEVIYTANSDNSSNNNYRVEDIHKQREEEFNNKMQEQENNMNELLQPKKPKEVSFADTKDDKPIGGEMDMMIQNMLTSRERQLETISSNSQDNITNAKKWIQSSNVNVHEDNHKTDDNNKPLTEIVLEPKDNIYASERSLMSKFKKKDPVMDELKELKQNQTKLFSLVEKILSILETTLLVSNNESNAESNNESNDEN
jgi:hypothetical protein